MTGTELGLYVPRHRSRDCGQAKTLPGYFDVHEAPLEFGLGFREHEAMEYDDWQPDWFAN